MGNIYVSYWLDSSLAQKKFTLKIPDWDLALSGLQSNEKQIQLYILLNLLVVVLAFFLLFVFGNSYKAKLFKVTPRIKIPMPAGQGQNGTAWFMDNNRKKAYFDRFVIEKGNSYIAQLAFNGQIYYAGVKKSLVPKGKLLPSKQLTQSGGIVCGWEKRGSKEIILYLGQDVHVLIVGKTGSGKSRGMVVQSICLLGLAGEGIVVSDPKGELYSYTARYLESLGYEVIVMDFQHPEKSSAFNPLQNIINAVNENETDKAQRATWDFVESIVERSDKGEPIWTNGEKAIIGACVLCVVYDNKERPEYQNLTNVYYFLANMVKVAEDKKTPLEHYMNELDDSHPAKALLGISDVAPSRTRGSFYTSALTTLRLYASKDIYSITRTSDFNMADIGQKKQAIFYILPDQKTTYYPIVTLMVNQQYEELVEFAKKNGNRLPNRVNFVLDEFGNFSTITDFSAKMTVARGYGIRFNLFLQDFAQLDEKYGENVCKIIKSNASVWIYLSAGDDTQKVISERLGQYTTLKYSMSGNAQHNQNATSGFSTAIEGRKLLETNELEKIERPYQLVIPTGEDSAIMYSPDLSKWCINQWLGLGKKKHNTKFIQNMESGRNVLRETNNPICLWKIWEEYTPEKIAKREEEKQKAELIEKMANRKQTKKVNPTNAFFEGVPVKTKSSKLQIPYF